MACDFRRTFALNRKEASHRLHHLFDRAASGLHLRLTLEWLTGFTRANHIQDHRSAILISFAYCSILCPIGWPATYILTRCLQMGRWHAPLRARQSRISQAQAVNASQLALVTSNDPPWAGCPSFVNAQPHQAYALALALVHRII
jgi:hypothetical protein